jgi:hypothetical protein
MSKDTKIGLSIVLGIFLIGIVLAAQEMRDSISYFLEHVIPYNLGYYAIGFILLLFLMFFLLPKRSGQEKSEVKVEQSDLSEQSEKSSFSGFTQRKGLLIALWIFSGGMLLAIAITWWPKEVNQIIEFLFSLVSPVFQSRGRAQITFVIIIILYLLIRNLWKNRTTIIAKIKHPKFFEEMRSVLRSTLSPLDFVESEVEGRGNYQRMSSSVTFKRGGYAVRLKCEHDFDQYFITAYVPQPDKNTLGDEFEHPLSGFSVRGEIIEADRFKKETIEKLNDWITKIKEGVEFR